MRKCSSNLSEVFFSSVRVDVSPLNGTGCDCFAEQMRRATPSMHCSFSPSRSFSFFLPSRMTESRKVMRERHVKLLMSLWRDDVTIKLTFLLLLLGGEAKRHAIEELASLRVEGKSPYLLVQRNTPLVSTSGPRISQFSPEDFGTCFLRCFCPGLDPLPLFCPSPRQPASSRASSQPEAPWAPEPGRAS
jgi:hypothetical protein